MANPICTECNQETWDVVKFRDKEMKKGILFSCQTDGCKYKNVRTTRYWWEEVAPVNEDAFDKHIEELKEKGGGGRVEVEPPGNDSSGGGKSATSKKKGDGILKKIAGGGKKTTPQQVPPSDIPGQLQFQFPEPESERHLEFRTSRPDITYEDQPENVVMDIQAMKAARNALWPRKEWNKKNKKQKIAAYNRLIDLIRHRGRYEESNDPDFAMVSKAIKENNFQQGEALAGAEAAKRWLGMSKKERCPSGSNILNKLRFSSKKTEVQAPPKKRKRDDDDEEEHSLSGQVLHLSHDERGPAYYARTGAVPASLHQRRVGVPGATVSIWGPFDIGTTPVIVDSKFAGTTHTDQWGFYHFHALDPGNYIGRAEKFGTPSQEGLISGYFSQTKKFKLPRDKVVNYEIEQKGERGFDVGIAGRARRDELETIRRAKRFYLAEEGARIEDRLNTLLGGRHGGDANLRGIASEFHHMQARGDPTAHEYLRDALFDAEMRFLEEGSGGRIRITNHGRTVSMRHKHVSIGSIFGRSAYSDPNAMTSKLINAAALTVAGMILAAFAGSFWLFLGFLMLGASALLPAPGDLKSIANELNRIQREFSKERANLITDENRPSGIAEREAFENHVRTQVMLTMAKLQSMGMFQAVGTSVIAKEVLRIFGLMAVSLGFVLSTLPMAKPIGVIAALVSYFSFTFHRQEDVEVPENIGGWFRNLRTRTGTK